MKKIVFSLVLLFVINSAAMAAHQLSEFPLGMPKMEALAKGLVLQDQQGGLMNIAFGGREWPTALVFENDKLVYLLLKGNGDEYVSAINYGLVAQLGWLIIYEATDKNLVFDAIKLASSGMDEMAIADEYEKFLTIMESQRFTSSTSVYISSMVWAAFKQLRGENPVDTYPEATLCHATINGNDVSLVFTTFGYMDRIKK